MGGREIISIIKIKLYSLLEYDKFCEGKKSKVWGIRNVGWDIILKGVIRVVLMGMLY